jgi:hypothetical protein
VSYSKLSISTSWKKALGILEKLAKEAKIHLQQFGKHIWQIDTLDKFMSRADSLGDARSLLFFSFPAGQVKLLSLLS